MILGMDIDTVLSRGVSQVLPDKKGLASLMKKKKITLYQGFDPSTDKLHIGHMVGIRKLAQFQKLGHKVIFLVGDFTGMIGDPTDKSAARQKLTKKQVLGNAKGYKKQIGSMLRFEGENAAEIKYNSEWLGKLSFEEILELSSNFTVQQMLERDFFQSRITDEKPIYLHEFLYPLMQGYDSVVMGVDLEVGATDQLFNMMAGRSLMKALKKKEKFVLSLKLLEDPSGKKMGKTEGNAINLTDEPENIFGGVMSLPDGFIQRGIEILTNLPMNAAEKKPIDAKKALALEVVKQIYGVKKAKGAMASFEKTFQKGEPEFTKLVPGKGTLLETISDLVGSNSETKRLIIQGGIDIDGKTVTDPFSKIKTGDKIKVGKKEFIKIK